MVKWYEKALRGNYKNEVGKRILQVLSSEIMVEFPATDSTEFGLFFNGRNYHTLSDSFLKI